MANCGLLLLSGKCGVVFEKKVRGVFGKVEQRSRAEREDRVEPKGMNTSFHLNAHLFYCTFTLCKLLLNIVSL